MEAQDISSSNFAGSLDKIVESLERASALAQQSIKSGDEVRAQQLDALLVAAIKEAKNFRDQYSPLIVAALNARVQSLRSQNVKEGRAQSSRRWWFQVIAAGVVCGCFIVASWNAVIFLHQPISGEQAVGFCALIGLWAVLAVVASRFLRLLQEENER